MKGMLKNTPIANTCLTTDTGVASVIPIGSQAAVRSKAVVLLLFIYCFMYYPLLVGLLCWSLFWCRITCCPF